MTAEKPDLLRNERFHLKPYDRLMAVATLSGVIGVGLGLYEGIKTSSLRYLTENAHRLPTTVGGWYFYHKKKNYVMVISGCKQAVKYGTKYSIGVSSFFLLEAGLDYVRHTTDFLNTTLAGTLMAFAHGTSKQMSRVQRFNHVKKGAFLALMLGIGQDFLISARGGDVWYVNKFKAFERDRATI
ncbi:CIC11C00000005647 [Sungouiella intermedia]|uniref:CIC11C00000005647 n=1 Tax=Sungouiella intermedia TaxID=45354 RepID=A0A1L0BF77_9ASCO|nr:CIC11C00000005647 [[Candida] intermedia]